MVYARYSSQGEVTDKLGVVPPMVSTSAEFQRTPSVHHKVWQGLSWRVKKNYWINFLLINPKQKWEKEDAWNNFLNYFLFF